MLLVGVVLSLIACLWNQSKDMVTKQDLAAVTSSMQGLQGKVDILSNTVSELQGELKAEKKLR